MGGAVMRPAEAAELAQGAAVRITHPALYGVQLGGDDSEIGDIHIVHEGAEGIYRGAWSGPVTPSAGPWLHVAVKQNGRTWDVPVQAPMIEAVS